MYVYDMGTRRAHLLDDFILDRAVVPVVECRQVMACVRICVVLCITPDISWRRRHEVGERINPLSRVAHWADDRDKILRRSSSKTTFKRRLSLLLYPRSGQVTVSGVTPVSSGPSMGTRTLAKLDVRTIGTHCYTIQGGRKSDYVGGRKLHSRTLTCNLRFVHLDLRVRLCPALRFIFGVALLEGSLPTHT